MVQGHIIPIEGKFFELMVEFKLFFTYGLLLFLSITYVLYIHKA